ncbi:MAG: selenocysteine-specific translation elongation factor [Pseudomonadota bacterium]
MIVATAGHVDHGKTSLIKQLTGEDTDTLEEEKRRGLTINLGFAFLDTDSDARIGFIDVPGHRRFINTMIAGVGGINLAMLVVAANEGPKPQTLEHLEVLKLLGVSNIIVIVSFIDAADAGQRSQSESEVLTLFTNAGLSPPKLFGVSNVTGEGIKQLKDHLLSTARSVITVSADEHFRMFIDRSFILTGTGLVVTGTVRSGEVRNGDQLVINPHNSIVRVRSLHAENRESDVAVRGQRCALNLAGGIDATKLERGNLLHDKKLSLVTDRVDCWFDQSLQNDKPLRHMLPVKLYLGAQKLSAKFVVAQGKTAKREFQNKGYLQLQLSSPISCCYGDRFLLRDDSEEFIIGGGYVVNPFAIRNRAMGQEWQDYLRSMDHKEFITCLNELLCHHASEINLSQLSQARNVQLNTALEYADQLDSALDAKQFTHENQRFVVAGKLLSECMIAAKYFVTEWHKNNTQKEGVPVRTVLTTMLPGYSEGLCLAAVSNLVASSVFSLQGGLLALAGHNIRLTTEQQALWSSLQNILSKAAPAIPTFTELKDETRLPEKELRNNLDFLVHKRYLLRISERRVALPESMLNFANCANELASELKMIEVVAFKNRVAIGRNLCVEILEYFDTIRFTQRRGNHRVVLDPEVPIKLFS